MKRFKQSLPAGPTPYAVLGVGPRATDEAIRKRYYELIQAEHPDKRRDRRPGPRWESLNRAYRSIDTQSHRESWRNGIALLSGGCAVCARYGVAVNSASRWAVCAACKGTGRTV